MSPPATPHVVKTEVVLVRCKFDDGPWELLTPAEIRERLAEAGWQGDLYLDHAIHAERNEAA